jgi:hypothetical protein
VKQPNDERGPDGRFRPGNAVRLTHGRRSRRAQLALLPGQEELRAALAEQRRAWLDDLGGAAELSSAARDLVQRGLRVRVLMDTLEARMDREGVLTGKGRTRASASLYLNLLDRLMKIYAALGLERRARRVPTAGEILREATR